MTILHKLIVPRSSGGWAFRITLPVVLLLYILT